MKHPEWTEVDTRTCKQIWAEYQKQHDLTERIGQTAGIDPKSGRIWFGDSILEIVEHRRAEGMTSPLFFELVGFKAYLWKGGRHRLILSSEPLYWKGFCRKEKSDAKIVDRRN